MKKRNLLYLLSAVLLVSCNNPNPSNSDVNNSTSNNVDSSESVKDSESSSEKEDIVDKDHYAVINSNYDKVYIYGVVGETFDLSKIDYSRCFNSKPTYKIDNTDGISIIGDTLTFNKKGIYTVQAYDGKLKHFQLQISVNENDENRYSYPLDINYSKFTQQSGSSSKVSATDNSVTLKAEGSTWNRITYDLDDSYNTNYTIECDISFVDSIDSTRWFGLVFRDQETNNKHYPYYQFDFRKTTNINSSIEITYVYADGKYSYPYTGTWQDGGPGTLTSSDKVHMKLQLESSTVQCELSSGSHKTQFSASLPNVTSGNFGFQCAGSTVKVENIKINLNKNTKLLSTADSQTSKVNIYDDVVDELKPHMIASGLSTDEIYGVYGEAQQFFAKVKGEKLYNLNDEEMDTNLNDVFLELRGAYIPNLQVEDEKSLHITQEICKSFGIVDLNIWSTKSSILDKARELMPFARFGYIPTNVTSFETFDEIGNICREAGRHYANLVLIDSNLLNKENVSKAVGLGYSVVANAKNGEDYSVINGALSGCKLILANFNTNVQQQAELIYDNSVFNVDEKKSNIIQQAHSLFSIPYATGHRGSGNTGTNPKTNLPENTIASFKNAFENGAKSIEIDVHTTKDNKLAVIHNETTGEYTGLMNDLRVKSTKLADLQKLPLKMADGKFSDEYHIPSLEQVFDAFSGEEYKDKTIIVEVKDNLTKTGKAAIEVAKEKGWYNRITLITFLEQTAKELREYDPGVQVSYLNNVYRNNNEEYWSSVDSYLSNGVGLNSHLSTVSIEAIQESNARGQIYWLWTFGPQNYNEVSKFVLGGNNGFTTNYISFFTNNKYKLIADKNLKLGTNETKTLSAKSVTYSQKENVENNIEIIVLTNNAKSNGNSITRTAAGDIKVVIKHRTTWSFDSVATDFYIYSDIVTIK